MQNKSKQKKEENLLIKERRSVRSFGPIYYPYKYTMTSDVKEAYSNPEQRGFQLQDARHKRGLCELVPK